jgi:hypothetical protein
LKKLLLLLLLLGCDNFQKASTNIGHLKSLGYNNFNCSKLNYVEDEISYYKFSEYILPIDENLEMLIARCVNNQCEYEFVPNKNIPSDLICQIYYNDLNNTSEYHRDQIIMTFNIKKFNDIKE